MKIRSIFTAVALASVGAMIVTGCSSSSGNSTSPTTSASNAAVSLNFWSWAPNTQKLVDTWNKANPKIQVKYTDAGGGTDSSAKLLTASRAGNAPDLSAVEYTTLPSLIVAGVPLDITKYVSDIKNKFTPGTWEQVTFDKHIFAVPQDVGPMALVYRSDVLAKYNIAVPTTWQEFADAAAKVRAADPTAYLASIPADQMGFFAGVASEAGATWWSVKDNKWTVGIADPQSLAVASFFESMIDKGLISTEPLLTPAWNADVSAGKILSWPSALWASGVLAGVVPNTIGKWTMSALPQWKAGDTDVPYQGGSSVIVTKNSKYPVQAAAFAKWLNASKQGADMLLNTVNLYPAAISGQESAKTTAPPTLMPQQTDYYSTAAKIASNTIPVTWGPDYNLAETAFTDAVNKAIVNHTSWSDAFVAVQKAVVADMVKSGFKVTNK
jgi:multiple sugar transport system substrate-binding protein